MPRLRVDLVDANDDVAVGALRVLLAAYDASLDEDLRLAHVADEAQELTQRYAGGALILARADGVPIGCVVVNRIDARSAEIKRLYVVPQARGLGAGKALTETAIAFARSQGYGRVVLDTERRRLSVAYDLYRSLGFVECDAYGPVDYADPTYMELPLAAEND